MNVLNKILPVFELFCA